MEAAYVTWVRRYVLLSLGLGGALFFFTSSVNLAGKRMNGRKRETVAPKAIHIKDNEPAVFSSP